MFFGESLLEAAAGDVAITDIAAVNVSSAFPGAASGRAGPGIIPVQTVVIAVREVESSARGNCIPGRAADNG